MIDYHLHTLFCNHAVGGMELYIQRAVDLGLREICFLDHLTIRPACHSEAGAGRKTEPGLSMTPEEIPYYFYAVQILKQKYRDKINVKAGLEVDFNPNHTALYQDIVDTYAFDIIASSLHFPNDLDIVTHRSGWRYGEKDADDVYALYFEQLQKMLEYDYFDVICHIDLIKKYGRKPMRSFEKECDTILRIVKDKDKTIEVNTSGYDHPARDIYPSLEILKKCYQQRISITMGSDAHRPENVGRHYDRVLPILLSAGYRKLAVFTKRQRTEIQINKELGSFSKRPLHG
jgi:histidinol-phosphatase (PHP family)